MAILDPVLNPMLGLGTFWVIFIMSFLVSLIMVLIYKFMTDQTEMKRLKDSLKEFQKKLKTLKEKPEEMMKVQKEMMQVNMTYMGKSMKPTFLTFIPILLILGWMSAHLAYVPLMPNQDFTLTVMAEEGIDGIIELQAPDMIEVQGDAKKEFANNKAVFTLIGKEEGEYIVTLVSNGKEVDKQVTISNQQEYAEITESYKSDIFKSATLSNAPLKVFWKLSWLWTYIIFAVVFSMVLRKAMKVY